VVSHVEKANNSDDNDFEALIKESVKEALHKDDARPVHTSQANRQPELVMVDTSSKNKKKKNKNKNKNSQNQNGNGAFTKDFPALPIPEPKPQQNPKKNQNKPKQEPKKIDFLKTEEEKKREEKPVSFKPIEDNPFQLKAKKSQKTKNKNFPSLSGESATAGSILGETNKKQDIEVEYGITLKKNKNKRGGRR